MTTNNASQTAWAIDTAHSEIMFKVRHMMVSTVTGWFSQFEGSLHSNGDNFENASVNFTAQTASISTNNEQRDGHLRSDDFFNAEAYPQISFQSESFEKQNDDSYVVKGNLTIRDITNPVQLKATFLGTNVDPYGQTKAGFEISGSISRSAYNLKWNAITEAGSVVVSDEVKLDLNVQLVKQA